MDGKEQARVKDVYLALGLFVLGVITGIQILSDIIEMVEHGRSPFR